MRVVVPLIALFTLVMLAACHEVTLTDVSHKPQNRALVGTQYEVVGRVDAYGIRDHSKADVEYITLIPPPGIMGPEVGFEVPLEIGSKVTIMKVMRTNRWFDGGDAFIVSIDAAAVPDEPEARIELFRGNEGNGRLQLNPKIYRKIERYNNRAQ